LLQLDPVLSAFQNFLLAHLAVSSEWMDNTVIVKKFYNTWKVLLHYS